MDHRIVRTLGLLVLLAGSSGCDLFDPARAADIAQVSLRLDVDPEEIAPGDSTLAKVRLINEGYGPTALTAGACLGEVEIYQEQTVQDFRISPDPCWAVGSSLSIPAGDTLTQTWTIVAESSAGQPVATGSYVVYVTIEAKLSRGTELGDVVTPLTVQ